MISVISKGFGQAGWRLPTLQELESLVDPTQSDPSLPSGNPFAQFVQWSYYWSATTYASSTSNAWDVAFGNGGVGFDDKGGVFRFVWCVRGGQGVDPQ